MITAIIIEDEQRSREILVDMLKHFRNINILAVCSFVDEARVAIDFFQPELIFSDIELEKESAFNMLEQLKHTDFEVIFTTAYEKYAIQAIKFSALDYLLKPFSISDLAEAINNYQLKQDRKQSSSQLHTLFHNLKNAKKDSKKIVLPTLNGLEIIALKDIIRCESNINYTSFFLADGSKITVSKTLKEFDSLLDDYDFIRVHNSHLINLNHVKKYTRGEGGIVTMSDYTEVDVSRRKKDEFLKRLSEL